MKPILATHEHLRMQFAAFAENTFQVELGVADPPLVDYLVDLLVRFVRNDVVFRFRDSTGRRMQQVADMLSEAEQRTGKPRREIYRHIGDFTLFWSGVFPEALGKLRTPDEKDHLLDYFQQGKRSYYIASTFDDDPFVEEAPVLRRLSQEFEMCTYGLNRVRHIWEKEMPEQARLPE